MRRAIVSSTATVSGIVLLLGLKSHATTTTAQAHTFSIDSGSGTSQSSGQTGGSGTTGSSGNSGTSGSSNSSGSSGGSSGSSSGGTSAAPNPAKTTPAAAAKTVAGDAAQTRYGPVQVQITLNGTKITKIDVLQYPSESGRDIQINDYALPILNQEAMTAQSAQIDVVSGATFTSDGYAQSLQSAIDKAKA